MLVCCRCDNVTKEKVHCNICLARATKDNTRPFGPAQHTYHDPTWPEGRAHKTCIDQYTKWADDQHRLALLGQAPRVINTGVAAFRTRAGAAAAEKEQPPQPREKRKRAKATTHLEVLAAGAGPVPRNPEGRRQQPQQGEQGCQQVQQQAAAVSAGATLASAEAHQAAGSDAGVELPFAASRQPAGSSAGAELPLATAATADHTCSSSTGSP